MYCASSMTIEVTNDASILKIAVAEKPLGFAIMR
jgi:hypothetical protein